MEKQKVENFLFKYLEKKYPFWYNTPNIYTENIGFELFYGDHTQFFTNKKEVYCVFCCENNLSTKMLTSFIINKFNILCVNFTFVNLSKIFFNGNLLINRDINFKLDYEELFEYHDLDIDISNKLSQLRTEKGDGFDVVEFLIRTNENIYEFDFTRSCIFPFIFKNKNMNFKFRIFTDSTNCIFKNKNNILNENDDTVSNNGNNTCMICMTNRLNVIFTKCNHVCCCISCSKKFEKCPICNIFSEKKKIFIQTLD